MPIAVDIDVMLAKRKMSVGELADRVGITPANLAVLKNGRANAVRFATLAALCEVLNCQPGDLLRWEADDIAGQVTLPPEPAAPGRKGLLYLQSQRQSLAGIGGFHGECAFAAFPSTPNAHSPCKSLGKSAFAL